MAYVEELIRSEGDGSFSFGNPSLDKKSKVDGFSHGGDSYKVKTYDEITKLEKNGMFLYESVPGTCVNNMRSTTRPTAVMTSSAVCEMRMAPALSSASPRSAVSRAT